MDINNFVTGKAIYSFSSCWLTHEGSHPGRSKGISNLWGLNKATEKKFERDSYSRTTNQIGTFYLETHVSYLLHTAKNSAQKLGRYIIQNQKYYKRSLTMCSWKTGTFFSWQLPNCETLESLHPGEGPKKQIVVLKKSIFSLKDWKQGKKINHLRGQICKKIVKFWARRPFSN